MSKKHITLIILLTNIICYSQSVKKSLLSPALLKFKNNFIVYGFEQKQNNLNFNSYLYNQNLVLIDSLTYPLGKHTPSDYLDITVDSLHNVLNFYFQLANQKGKVKMIRVNDTLSIIGTADDIDIAHLNSMIAFDDEKKSVNENLYVIKSFQDTSGTMFFLSKYKVKDMTKPFEYELKWQFPFDRKHIHRASILYADTNQIVVYAHVNEGVKKGQWILKIDSKKGELIKGAKLNPKDDDRHFLLSNISVTNKGKNIDVIGSIYENKMIDFNSNKYNFTNLAKQHKIFIINIDSLGEITRRVERIFPLPIQTKTTEGLKSFHVKVREFIKNKDNSFNVWLDVYEQTKPLQLCYYSSWQIDVIPDEVDYTFNQSKFLISTSAIPGYISFEKGDTYGKFILNQINEYDKFKYKNPLNTFITTTGIDDLGNSYYVLKKTNIMTATKSYNYISMGKKALENKIILSSEQGQKIDLLFMNNKKYLSFITNTANTEFQLKINNL